MPAMRPTLTAYCYKWHITTSPAFRQLLAEPLAPFLDVEFVAPPDLTNDTDAPLPATQPVIFCQRPPFPRWLADEHARIVWIPMWDLAQEYPQPWWNALPKTLRIVALSNAVAERAQMAGLPTLHLRYAQNPAAFATVDWQAERILMYWNRTGLVSPRAIRRLCELFDVRQVLFRETLDPYIPRSAAYRLTRHMGSVRVETFSGFVSYEDYLALLARTQIYVAPRASEGVGMAFLEAMASGCAVLAADAPTMNERIRHMHTGLVLPFNHEAHESNQRLRTFKRQRLLKRWRRRLFGPSFRYPITESEINLACSAPLDLEAIGRAARQSLATEHEMWKSRLTEYAQFILEW